MYPHGDSIASFHNNSQSSIALNNNWFLLSIRLPYSLVLWGLVRPSSSSAYYKHLASHITDNLRGFSSSYCAPIQPKLVDLSDQSGFCALSLTYQTEAPGGGIAQNNYNFQTCMESLAVWLLTLYVCSYGPSLLQLVMEHLYVTL